MSHDWLKHHRHDWLKLASFDEACRYFDNVRTATYFRVLMPDGSMHIVTRARLEVLAKSADVDRIAYEPVEPHQQ